MTTPDALSALQALQDEVGDSAVVGVGTVRTAADAERALAAGIVNRVVPAADLEAAALVERGYRWIRVLDQPGLRKLVAPTFEGQ